MDTPTLLASLRARGITLAVEGPRLLASPGRLLRAEDAAAIRASKGELRLFVLGRAAQLGGTTEMAVYLTALSEYEAAGMEVATWRG